MSDEVFCPFCDSVVWDGESSEPCEHLIADWDFDASANGGGVLGEMYVSGGGFASAGELGKTSRKLCARVWSTGAGDEDEGIVTRETADARLRLAATVVMGEDPVWWAALQETILDCSDPEAWVHDYDDSDSSYQVPDDWLDPETLAEFADPLASAVVENLPGIKVTYEVLGGMTSGTVYFVWSEDASAGQAAIEATFSSATKTIETMIAKLDARDSGR